MSIEMNKLAKKLNDAITESSSSKPKPYDPSATVIRVDGDTAWVHIAGGVDETPVERTINARPGDTVKLRISGGRAWIVGNNTAPPTDDYTAIYAKTIAVGAQSTAESAMEDATRAKEAADAAEYDANRAYNAAETANTAANGALSQLGVVEDVVGTLNWISQHGEYELTTDTEVVPGKYYFSKSGDVYTVVINPTGNPSAQGYYELDSIDEAVSNYVASHLALTDAGLWVVNDNNSYKILLANNGMKVYDSQGNLVSTFGESISFSSSRAQYIGGEDAYIIFYDSDDDDIPDTIQIGGNVIFGNDKSLSEVITELNNTFIFDTTYSISNGVATFEAHLYQGGQDIKTKYPTSQFTWYIKTEDGEQPIGNPNTGYTKQVNISQCGYGAEIVAHFTTTENSNLQNRSGDQMTTRSGESLTVRSSGDSVQVNQLPTSTTVYSIEKILVVGTEDEHLISMQTLQDYLNANLDKQVLFNTTSGWDSQTTLESEANTLYIYTDHQTDSHGNNVAGIKVGDGSAYVVDLPFIDAIATEHIADTTVHITSAERTAWNNKVRCYYASGDNLIFTTS